VSRAALLSRGRGREVRRRPPQNGGGFFFLRGPQNRGIGADEFFFLMGIGADGWRHERSRLCVGRTVRSTSPAQPSPSHIFWASGVIADQQNTKRHGPPSAGAAARSARPVASSSPRLHFTRTDLLGFFLPRLALGILAVAVLAVVLG
jgi:hypothetical protein